MHAADTYRQPQAARAALDAIRERIAERLDLGGQWWRTRDLKARTVLVTLATEPGAADPRDVARQPWRAFTPEQRERLRGVAMYLEREFKGAGCLTP